MNQKHQTQTKPKTKNEEIPFKDFVKFNVDFLKSDKICILSKEKFDKVVAFIEQSLGKEAYQFHWCICAKEHKEGRETGSILATSIDEVPGYPGKQFFMYSAAE